MAFSLREEFAFFCDQSLLSPEYEQTSFLDFRFQLERACFANAIVDIRLHSLERRTKRVKVFALISIGDFLCRFLFLR